MDRKENVIPLLILLVFIGAILVYLGFSRSFFTYGTETDYLGGFLPEAERVLAGEPLQLSFHPPFYSFVLAGVQTIIGNWFYTGIVVSLFSCFVVIISNYFLFENCCGRYAGWAVFTGFIISSPFLTYSCFATSDVFFLALYSSCLLFAYHAYEKGSHLVWTTCGFICGLALLTRSNSITLLALLVLPWLKPIPVKQRLSGFIMLILGICIPIFLWICFAKITGGPLAPAGNHINIALTYFAHGADRISGDARAPLEEEFTSLWQVLSHDPVHIVKTYISDLLHNRALEAGELFPFPVNYLAAVAFIFMLFRKPANVFWYCLIILTIFQVLLVNFKAYETRYYLFLLPVLAAPIGIIIYRAYHGFSSRFARYAMIALVISGIGFISMNSTKRAFSALHKNDKELSEAINKISQVVEKDEGSIIFSRKQHLPYYLGMKHSMFPRVKNEQELEDFFRQSRDTTHVYLYYGPAEKSSRPQFMSVLENMNGTFKVVAQSDTASFWKLYKYIDNNSINR